MRLWLVEPKIMCRQHLLGEHNECHAFVGTINKGTRIYGYIQKGLLQHELLHSRHDELVNEMLSRGYKHLSPLPKITKEITVHGFINRDKSLNELLYRCPECRQNSLIYGI